MPKVDRYRETYDAATQRGCDDRTARRIAREAAYREANTSRPYDIDTLLQADADDEIHDSEGWYDVDMAAVARKRRSS